MKTLAVSPSAVESSSRRSFIRTAFKVAGAFKLACLGGTAVLHRQAIGRAVGLLPPETPKPLTSFSLVDRHGRQCGRMAIWSRDEYLATGLDPYQVQWSDDQGFCVAQESYRLPPLP